MLIESYGDRYKAQIFSLISKRTQPFVIAVLAPQLSALHLLKPLPQQPTLLSRSFHPRCLIKHINNSVRQLFFIKSVIWWMFCHLQISAWLSVLTCWNTCLIQWDYKKMIRVLRPGRTVSSCCDLGAVLAWSPSHCSGTKTPSCILVDTGRYDLFGDRFSPYLFSADRAYECCNWTGKFRFSANRLGTATSGIRPCYQLCFAV